MSNVNRPMGLRPVYNLDGSPWNGQVRMYLIPSSNAADTFVGDPVRLEGNAGAAGLFVSGVNCEGIATAVRAGPGSAFVGAIVGFLPDPNELTLKYRKGGTNRIALVAGPDVLYEIQESGTAMTSADVGLNANIVLGSGNTTTGISTAMIDNSTKATTSTLDLQLLGLIKRVDNVFGSHAKWLVRFNVSQFKAGTAGIA